MRARVTVTVEVGDETKTFESSTLWRDWATPVDLLGSLRLSVLRWALARGPQ